MANASIADLRSIIDTIDKQIVALLNERAQTAIKLGQVKDSLSKNTYDPSREHQVLATIDALNSGPLPKGSIEEIYAAIMTACREIQIKQTTH